MGYTVLEWDSGRRQYWLHLPMGDGWVVGYRVTYHGDGPKRRVRINEVRIVPGLPPGHPNMRPGFDPSIDNELFWEARRKRGDAKTFVPFSFDAVRRGVTARLFADALAAAQSWPDEADPEPYAPLEPSAAAPKVGRPPVHSRLFYAMFAQRYHQVEHGTRRERGESTRAILALRYKVPVSTIGKWIRMAREYGLLTAAVRTGSRGGMVTEKALALIARGKK